MPATVTLASTSFLAPLEHGDTIVNLASTSGVVPGVRLFAGRELLAVERLTGIGNLVAVRRGVDGTPTTRHASTETVYIGRGDQFFQSDPVGIPLVAVPVSPHINVNTGVAWVVQGDDVFPGSDSARTWQPITTSQAAGALGVRVNTTITPQ